MKKGLLLDTHAVLWLSTASPRLGAHARQAICQAPKVSISAASVWEAAIKVHTGKLHAPPDLMGVATAAGLSELPVLAWHTGAVAELGLRLPHRDPFDAILVKQAALENLTLVTADARILEAGLCDVLDASR